MKKRIILFLSFLLMFAVSSFSQKELVISGGSSVSSLVCSNNFVFVTGANEKGNCGASNCAGTLGVGSSASKVSEWTQVIFPNNETMQQVNSGSGQSFIALSCGNSGNKVWCWGDNTSGQCGQGTIGGIVDHPAQVKAGCLAGTAYDCDGYLCNVDVVYAGNANSFAILGDGPYKGYLVAWGGNMQAYESSLGVGHNNRASSPEWCVDLNGNKMKNVVQIFSGDDATLALDSDGHVWSCGAVQKTSTGLGRLAAGGYCAPTGNNGGPSNKFGLVYVAQGQPLSNITQIAAGDVSYLALDKDGYVWSWGDTWNHACGQGANIGSSSPQRVIKGNTDDEDNDGTYLLAKQIGAGQSSGMAVSITGKPVTWGAYCGQGSVTTAEVPGYVQYAANKVHNDVILINKGDQWGFYGRSDGSMYTWGNNDNGQLGTTVASYSYATKINPPVSCNSFKDPKPNAAITPKSMKVCASSFAGVTLDCGFMLTSASMLDAYEITWYKDGVQVLKGNATKYEYTTPQLEDGLGTYKVKIHYVGHNSGCEQYEDAEDEITISAYEQTYAIPTLEYCEDSATVKVNAQNSKAVYSWYNSKGANAKPVVTTIGSASAKMFVGDIIPVNGKKTIYVEESSMNSGYLVPNPGSGSLQAINQTFAAPGLLVEEATTIESLSTSLSAALSCSYTSGTTEYETQEEALAQVKQLSGSVTMTVKVYGSRINNQKYVADASNCIKTITKTINYNYEYKATSTQSSWNGSAGVNYYKPIWSNNDNITDGVQKVDIPIDIEFAPGYYFFSVTLSSSGAINTNNTKMYKYSSFAGATDNMNGKVSVYGATTNGVSSGNFSTQDLGPFYNWRVTSGQGFCDRIAINLEEHCPCQAPEDFRVTSEDASLFSNDTAYICENNPTCTLETEIWAVPGSTQFKYFWKKNGSDLTATAYSNKSTPLNVTSEGTYTIVVQDRDANGTSCKLEKTVEVVLIPLPTVKISGGGTICEGETLQDKVTMTFTGVPKFRPYWDYTDPSGDVERDNKRTKDNKLVLDQPTEVGTHTYALVAVNDDWNCKNTNVSGSATVTIKPRPVPSLQASDDDCEANAPFTLTASSEPAGATFSWKYNNANAGTGTSKTLSSHSESGTYSVKATLDGCESTTEASKSIEIYETPALDAITADNTAVCSGETINLKSGASDDGNGTWTWAGNGVTGNGSTATVTLTTTSTTTVDVTLDYKSANNCVAEQKTITLTFYAMPNPPHVTDKSYCVDDTPEALKATGDANSTLKWWGTSSTGGTSSSAAPTPSTSSATVTYYYVSQVVNGCESEREKLTVTVDDTLSPVISADFFEACENTPIELSVEGDYATTTWSGTGAQYLDATSIASPTFTSGTANTYKVKVSVVDSKGCQGSAEKEITINPIPTASLSSLTNECESNTTAQTLTATITPSMSGTSVWTGAVTNTQEKQATFTPSAAGAGTYAITYAFTSSKGCAAKVVSTDVEVYGMPSPSLELSNYNVCVSGQNSDRVTARVNGVSGGTTTYSINSGTVDAATGTFDPTANTAGTYKITAYYVDDNGCDGTSFKEVVVNNLPVIEFASTTPSEICYNGAPINIEVTATPTGGTGTWTGTSSGSTYDPTTAAETTEISYTYTDLNRCVNKASTTITKITVPTPPAIDIKTVLKNAGALNNTTELTGATAEAGDILEWMTEDGSSVLASNVTTFETNKTASDPAGSYKYAVHEYRLINGKECYSVDSVIATLVISECNALAPKSVDRYVCVGSDASQTFTSTRTLGATPPNNYEIAWLDFDPVGLNGDQTTIYRGESFTPNVSTATASATEYYVAEYDKDNNCWSAGTKVTLRVVDNPLVTITSPDNVCAKGSDEVQVTVNPQNGVLSSSNGALNGFTWMPGDYNGASETVEFTYTVTSAQYSDGTTCSTTKTSTTTAHFMEAPTGSENVWLIGQVSTIPDDLLDGTLTSTGTSMNWYDTKGLNNKLKENSLTYAPDKDALAIEVLGKTTYSKSWWVTQIDGYGCESQASEVTLELLDCPWEAPTAQSIETCIGDNIDALSALEGASVSTMASSGVTSWIWYDSNKNEVSSSTSSTFNHQVSNTTAGETTYYVAYKAIEKSSLVECQSPITKVTVNVLELPSITFDKASEIVCYTSDEVKVNVRAASSNGSGNGTWSITGDSEAISQNGIFYPKKNCAIDGQKQYTITYSYTDEKQCSNSESRTIDVVYLNAPETKGFYSLTSQTNPVTVEVTSTLSTGATAKWFDNNIATDNAKGEGATYATGDAVDRVIARSYYARQYKDGCYSEATEAIVKIVPCPIPQVNIEDKVACNYDMTPQLEAITGGWDERDGSFSTFKFYTATSTEESTSGNWTPSISNAGEYTYNVSEYNSTPVANLTYNEGCEGPKKQVKVTITGTSIPTVTSQITEICEGETSPTFIANNTVGTVYWFEENPGELGEPEVQIDGTGLSYTPRLTTEGEHSIYAVMFSNNCYGPKVEKKFKVKGIPEAPVTGNSEICLGETNVPVTATSTNGATISWYKENTKATKLGTGASYTSKEEFVGEYNYYASQTLNGCEGNTSTATFTIKALPSPPVIDNQANICEYDEAPILYANGANIKWYASDKETVIGTDNDFHTTDMTSGTKRYYATQTVNGCEGLFANLTYVVNAKPENPVTVGANMCEGSQDIPFLTTNMSIDKWYSDEFGINEVGTGYTFAPDAEIVNSNDLTYYVLREMNNCKSDLTPALLHIIKKPTFEISQDTALCIYDSVATIEAFHFVPEFNATSKIEWNVKKGRLTKYYDDVDHGITPTETVKEDGEYNINAIYKYIYDNVMCTSDTMSMTYRVIPRAIKPIVFTSVICQGEEIKDLQALGSPNIIWGSLDGTLPVVCYGNRYKFQAGQHLDTGTYRFVILDQNIYDEENNLGCKSEVDTVAMTVAPAAKTKLFGPDSVCLNATEQYYTQYTKESTYLWTVTGNQLNYSKDAKSNSVRYVDWQNTGVDTITVYEQTWAGCEGADTMIVKIAPIPEPYFVWEMPGASNIIELRDSTIQDSIVFNDTLSEVVTYKMLWNFGYQGSPEGSIDTVIDYGRRNIPFQKGGYLYGYNCPTLKVVNSYGCESTYKECIFVNIATSLFVPTSFAPMNPAHSVRNFQPKGFNLKECKVSVYDKWGNLLWYSDEVEDGVFIGSWDGTYDGKMMQSDVYIWKIEAEFLDGQVWQGIDSGNGKKSKFGSVTLIR